MTLLILLIPLVMIALGLLPVYTPLNLWWLLLGIPISLSGVGIIIHAFTPSHCWQDILEGKPEALELLDERIERLEKIPEVEGK